MVQSDVLNGRALAERSEDHRATRTVAICGTAGSSRDEVMRQAADVELWGLNLSYKWMPRCDRWFEMHDPGIYRGVFSAEHREWLRTTAAPVYMQQRHEEFPTSIAYPVDAVTEGGRLPAYFTSSVAYMVALAVAEGVSEIRLLGVNMATGSEYAYQRSATEFWIGVALSRGIKVYLPPSAPLLKGPRYGAVGASADIVRGIVDTREATKLQMEQAQRDLIDFMRGALMDPADLEERRAELRDRVHEVEITMYACLGGIQVLDKLTDGQVALSPEQSGLVAIRDA